MLHHIKSCVTFWSLKYIIRFLQLTQDSRLLSIHLVKANLKRGAIILGSSFSKTYMKNIPICPILKRKSTFSLPTKNCISKLLLLQSPFREIVFVVCRRSSQFQLIAPFKTRLYVQDMFLILIILCTYIISKSLDLNSIKDKSGHIYHI